MRLLSFHSWVLALAVVPVSVTWPPPNAELSPVPLGVQQCNTRCQTVYTDCIDHCDGVKSCQESCTRDVDECVTACTTPSPKDSAAPKAPSPPASGSAAPGPAPPGAPKDGKGKPSPKPAKPGGTR